MKARRHGSVFECRCRRANTSRAGINKEEKGRPLLGGSSLVLAYSSASLLSTFKCVCCDLDHHGVTAVAIPNHVFDGSSKKHTGRLGKLTPAASLGVIARPLAVHSSFFSIRRLGLVSFVSTARLNRARRLRGVSAGSRPARTCVAPSASLNFVTTLKRRSKSAPEHTWRTRSTAASLISVVRPRDDRELIKRSLESLRFIRCAEG